MSILGELGAWRDKLSHAKTVPMSRDKEISMLGEFMGFLIEHGNVNSSWANNAEIYGYFERFINLLRRHRKYKSRAPESLALFDSSGLFVQIAAYWLLSAEVNKEVFGRIGDDVRATYSRQILNRGLAVVRNERERAVIAEAIKEANGVEKDWQTQRFWLEMEFHNVGIKWNRKVNEMWICRLHDVYPNGTKGESREFSFEELRAQKYMTSIAAKRNEEPNVEVNNEMSEPMSIDSLPELIDESIIDNDKNASLVNPLTGPIHLQQSLLENEITGANQELTTNHTLQMPTAPMFLPCSGKKLEIYSDNSINQQLTGAILCDMPSIADLSIDEEEKENHLLKRDSSVLTPRCPRTKKTLKETKANVTGATPTYVINNANQMIDNFFNETNVIYKKEQPDTLRLDTPTLGGGRGQHLTARLFGNESTQNTPDQGPKGKLNIFHESILGSNAQSLCTTPSSTMGTSFNFNDDEDDSIFDKPTINSESTRAVNFSSGATRDDPNLSAVVDNPNESTLGYDPWSEQFVKMQMGQLMIRDDPVDQSFSERKQMFLINGTNYAKERLLGEGAFAKVYLCTALGDTTKVAVKVQKEGTSWEPAILRETSKRLKGTFASTAISDFLGSCLYSSGEGVIITSYYNQGTLLDLCAFCRPKLVTRSIDMKPAVLFFSAQLINLMIALHQVDILHADFKPDNIMLTEIDTFTTILDANGNIQGIKLIDFGRAINNRAVAPTVPFTGVCYTSNFSCPQMHAKSEWRYQVDLYALGMSLHVIMFGDYSKIDPKSIKKGRVPINFSIPRHFDRSAWKEMYDDFLNHDGLGNGMEKLLKARDYCVAEYQSMDERDIATFRLQYSSYLSKNK